MKDVKSKVITANALSDGRVVYLAQDGRWVDMLVQAKLFSGAELDEALEQANARAKEITGAYAIEISEHGLVGRDRLREKIRSLGPTVRLDLGKQSDSQVGHLQ